MGISNVTLAEHIREVSQLRESSWDGSTKYGEYKLSYDDCIQQVVGDDPIGIILACLFTAGYSDMYDFCDQVLGVHA